MTICDTGPLVALIDADDVHHTRCRAALPSLSGPLLTTVPCLTEAMHFLGKARGWEAQSALWQFIRRGALRLHRSDANEESRIAELMEQYRDAPMDFADASLVALAESLHLTQIFTLDSHFYAYQIDGRQSFEIVPLDH